MRRLILASSSPRRRELLEQLGLRFEVRPSQVAERVDNSQSPDLVVLGLARQKAHAVAAGCVQREDNAVVIGSDTIVVCNGQILGKPRHAAEARAMLQKLSGATHEVYTGLSVVDSADGHEASAWEKTRVHFADISDEEISAYVETGEPMDKAGSYGIQAFGAMFVEGIEGDYFTVVGLPLRRLYLMLREFGVDPLVQPS